MIIYSMILNKQTTLFLFNIKTMVRRSIKQFVKENYVLDFTVQGSCNGKDYKDVPVNVYRPKLMKELPEEMKEYVTGVSLGCYDDRGYPSWDCGNPDYGRWDAFCVFRYLAGRTDVYVCSILRRPFTDDQQKFYEKHCAFIMAPYRIYAPWDSAADSPEARELVKKYMKENPKSLY